MKYTGINLQTLQDKVLILTLENRIRGEISSAMGDRYVKSDQSKTFLYIDATKIYGHSRSKPLPYDENEMGNGHPDVYMKELVAILNNPDCSDIGYFPEDDLSYPDDIKEKTKNFPFCPENKKIKPVNIKDYTENKKPKKHEKTKKLI